LVIVALNLPEKAHSGRAANGKRRVHLRSHLASVITIAKGMKLRRFMASRSQKVVDMTYRQVYNGQGAFCAESFKLCRTLWRQHNCEELDPVQL